ncbi:RimJ/RimL family protein N-acetyltransferase [Mobilisporobacter senegalensis]|uniref:RimJ/RimL family protein N-acetyltransferase n=1 Tax=Mobilisporobacter senegalensis TaxID=1329262 RepID=A0A3N1XEW6_9FIRM|nr:GNAT family N-acetyltransferase [Mobilisporobacter senegalensis]ROR25280.1 RimJ/RimL family protein N-acetyltransferase [Mobilisporobacter senegalensis]
MKFGPKIIKLKDGRECILRSPVPRDAKALIEHMKGTSNETLYMARYPEEITITIEEEKRYLKELESNPKNVLICATIDGKIIACGGLNCVKNLMKYIHRAEFGISIQKEYWHLGIGSSLLSELILLAKDAGYEQIELEVMCDNERGIGLYKKCGFEMIGTREKAFKFKDGTYGDEYLMFRKL